MEDLTRGTLLLLDANTTLVKINKNKGRIFKKKTYCLYCGYNSNVKKHILLCENDLFSIDSFKLISKTFIIQYS